MYLAKPVLQTLCISQQKPEVDINHFHLSATEDVAFTCNIILFMN